MKKVTSNLVKVQALASPSEQASLSRAQKTFNKLIKEIETEKLKFKQWQEAIPAYQKKYTEQLLPLQKEFDQDRLSMVLLLDQAFDQYKLSKTEIKKLSYILSDLAQALIEVFQDGDETEQLKAIYNKHSGGDFDAEMEEDDADMKAIMGEILGVELGEDFDFNSPEDIAKLMQAKENQANEDRARFAQAQPKPRKKSAKALAQEAKLEEEKNNIKLSLREVYRKLVSSLHPDREQDEAERKRKTGLMQRVNVAYEKQDLLGLLELQLEIEQIDQNMLNTLSEQRLKYFNKILTEQVNELKYESDELEFTFRIQSNIPPHLPLKPGDLTRIIEQFSRDARQDLASIKIDLKELKELAALKAMLKHFKIPKATRFDDEFFGDCPF
jgi:hypothetical protein